MKSKEEIEEIEWQTKVKFVNADELFKVAYAKPLREVISIDKETKLPVKFYQAEMDIFEFPKNTREKIWTAMALAINDNRIPPFTVLVPKSMVTKKRVPVEEVPLGWVDDSYIYIVPYIKEIMVYERE